MLATQALSCGRSIGKMSTLLRFKNPKYQLCVPKQIFKSYITKTKSKTRNFTSDRFIFLCCVSLSLGVVILLTPHETVSNIISPYYSLTYCEDSNGKKLHLPQQELIAELNKRLKIVRHRLSKLGKPTPDLLVSSTALPKNQNSSDEWCEIRFELDRNVNVGNLFKYWFQIMLNGDNSNKNGSATPVFKMMNGFMVAMSQDHNTRLQWYTDKQGHIVSVRKSPGFRSADVDDIVKGYEDVLLSFFQSNNNNNDEIDDDDNFYNKNRNDSSSRIMADDPAGFLQHILKNLVARGGGGNNGSDGIGGGGFQIIDDEDEELFVQKYNRPPSTIERGSDFQQRGGKTNNNTLSPLEKLEKLGIPVYNKQSAKSNTSSSSSSNINKAVLDTDTAISVTKPLTWDHLAGYDEIKRQIEDTVINSYLHADVYDAVVRATRLEFESNRPTALLLSGPPGTGKTLTARILASQCNRPLIVLKLEHIMSKWYGESEKKLTEIFDICELEMAEDGVIIFIDEVDALATSRGDSNNGDNGDDDGNGYSGSGGSGGGGGNMHEVTRRLLSVLLQRVEGFQGKCNSLIIAATNRHQDLDPALMSRFDLIIQYPLPDVNTRKAIIQRYAKQFTKNNEALNQLTQVSKNLSCRDIKEACEDVERKWASKIVKKEIKKTDVIPPLQEYLMSFQTRNINMHPNRQKPFNGTDI